MASFKKSFRGHKRFIKKTPAGLSLRLKDAFKTPGLPGADQFALESPERFNLDPNRFLLPEPSFLTNLQEIDQPLFEAEQQALSGLGADEAEARRRLINQVAATGRFGSEISAHDFAPLEAKLASTRAGVRGTFSQRRAEARQRAREQLLALRQQNLLTQRDIEEANIGRQFELSTGQADVALKLALAKISAKLQKRRNLAALIGSGITAASLGGFGGGGGGAAASGSAGASSGAAMGGFTDIGFG